MEQKGTTKPMIFRIDQCCREDNNGSLQESYGELISSWPPKSYTCSFCKREFRSAQALGGHMNVHRREKAKLRQIVTPQTTYLSSFLHHHHPLQPQAHVLDQNPNVKTSCFDVSSAFPATKFPPLSCFSDSCSFHLLCVSKFEGFRSQKSVDCSNDQKEGMIADEPKFDDLDLELRL